MPGRWRVELGETVSLALPVMIAQLAQIGMQSTDVALVGHFDSRSLSGVSLGHTLSSVLLLIGMGMCNAVSPLVSQAYGAGDLRACGRAMGQGMWVVLVVGLLCSVVVQFAVPILVMTGQDPVLAGIAQQYLSGMTGCYPFALLFLTLRQFVEGISLTRPAMLISLCALPLNGLLGYTLLYGPFGLPSLGVYGTGLATSIMDVLMCLALGWYVFGGKRFQQYQVMQVLEGPSWQDIRQIISLGIPIVVAFMMEVGAFAGTALMMGWLGPVPMAAHQVVISLATTTFMMPLGIAIAGSVRVGQAEGRGDRTAARRAGWMALGLAAVIMLVNAVVFTVIPGPLLGIFTADPAVMALSLELIKVAAAFQLFDGLQVAGAGVLRGLKDTRVPMIVTAIAFWGIAAPLAWALGFYFHQGPVGIWWGLCVGLIAASAFHMVRFAWKTRPQPRMHK